MKLGAFALAAAVGLTSAAAFADDAPAAAPTPAPAASAASATPLQTRAPKQLQLAPQNEGTPVGYKLLAGAVVVAGAIVYVKKKQKGGVTKNTKKKSAIDILARSSIGVRNELLVVDVEGTRLLVGMTPGSMNTLAVLQTPEGVVGEESPFMGEEKYMAPAELAAASMSDDLPTAAQVQAAQAQMQRKRPSLREQIDAEDAENEVEELEGRVRSLLSARNKKAELPAVTTPKRVAKTQPMSAASRVPGQAKGLLLSMQDADVTKLGDW